MASQLGRVYENLLKSWEGRQHMTDMSPGIHFCELVTYNVQAIEMWLLAMVKEAGKIQ